VPSTHWTARRFSLPISQGDHIRVEIFGCQAIGGELAGVFINAGGISIDTPAEARELAADILATADTMEALSA
jgi:hypothetical protein